MIPKPGSRAANRLVIRFVTARLKAATQRLRNRIRRIRATRIAKSKMTAVVIGMSNYLPITYSPVLCPPTTRMRASAASRARLMLLSDLDAGVGVFSDASLRNGCRYPLHRLRRSQHDQGYTDDNEGSHAQQFSASDQITECLHRHNGGVSKARPCCEGNQAAIRGRVTGCQQQENAECDIKAEHHRQRRLLPHKHDQGIS